MSEYEPLTLLLVLIKGAAFLLCFHWLATAPRGAKFMGSTMFWALVLAIIAVFLQPHAPPPPPIQ